MNDIQFLDAKDPMGIAETQNDILGVWYLEDERKFQEEADPVVHTFLHFVEVTCSYPDTGIQHAAFENSAPYLDQQYHSCA